MFAWGIHKGGALVFLLLLVPLQLLILRELELLLPPLVALMVVVVVAGSTTHCNRITLVSENAFPAARSLGNLPNCGNIPSFYVIDLKLKPM